MKHNTAQMATSGFELDMVFKSKAEWDAFSAASRWAFDPEQIERTVQTCLSEGIRSPFFGYAPGKDVSVRSRNYRESLLAFGFNPRQRAILDLIQTEYSGPSAKMQRIHLHEAVTRFALVIKGRFPFVLASEYLPDDESRRNSFPVPHVDICDSGLPDASFDLIVSQEVLEHVPSMDAAFQDMARILKPGGTLLATVPFLQSAETSRRKAALGPDGRVEYITEPEYHGNPVDPAGGSLVFELPGWDVLDRLRDAGFKTATVRAVGSMPRGIVARDMMFVLMLSAVR